MDDKIMSKFKQRISEIIECEEVRRETECSLKKAMIDMYCGGLRMSLRILEEVMHEQ